MSSTDTKLMTADELLALPNYVDGSDRRYELIRGELRTMSPTKPLHGVICGRLTVKVGSFVEEHELGEVFGAETGFLVQIDPDSLIAADMAFVSKERLATAETLEKFFPFAPDLAVEVLSPSNTVSEIDEKIALHFAAGSRPCGFSTRCGGRSRFIVRRSTCASSASRICWTAARCCRSSRSICRGYSPRSKNKQSQTRL